MVERWLIIADDTVVNVCLWDGDLATWQPESGTSVERWTGQAWTGWTRVAGEWVPPVYPDDEPVL
jgi:hypothetical protein